MFRVSERQKISAHVTVFFESPNISVLKILNQSGASINYNVQNEVNRISFVGHRKVRSYHIKENIVYAEMSADIIEGFWTDFIG